MILSNSNLYQDKLNRIQASESTGTPKIDLYDKYLDIKENNKQVQCILKDITRTFPKHIYFRDRFGQGQKSLYNVLKAFSSHYHNETGYVQGMGYIAGLLLTYMEEKQAFWTMIGLFEDFNMK